MSEETAEAAPISFGGLRKCLDVEAERAFLSSSVVNGLFGLGEWDALLGRIAAGDVSQLRTPAQKRAEYHPVAWGTGIFLLVLMIVIGQLWAMILMFPIAACFVMGIKMGLSRLRPWAPELVPLAAAAAEVLRRLQKDLEPGAPVQLLLDGRPPRNALRKDRAKSEAAQQARRETRRSGSVAILTGERERIRLQVSLRQGLTFSWSDSLAIVSKRLTGLGVRGTKSKTKERIEGCCRVELRGSEKHWALAQDLKPEIGVKVGEGKWRLRTEKTRVLDDLLSRSPLEAVQQGVQRFGRVEEIQPMEALEGATRLVACLVRQEKKKEAGA